MAERVGNLRLNFLRITENDEMSKLKDLLKKLFADKPELAAEIDGLEDEKPEKKDEKKDEKPEKKDDSAGNSDPALIATIKQLQDSLAAAKEREDKREEAIAKQAAEAQKAKIADEIKKMQTDGRIPEKDTAAVARWEKLYSSDFKAASEVAAQLPAKKQSPPEAGGQPAQGTSGTATADVRSSLVESAKAAFAQTKR
jgi:hypothetical protein